MLYQLIITCIAITGFYAATLEGNILFFIQRIPEQLDNYSGELVQRIELLESMQVCPNPYLTSKTRFEINKKLFFTAVWGWLVTALCWLMLSLSKPLYECLTCMASIWGTLMYFLYWHNPISLDYIIFIFALAGLNTLAGSAMQFAERVAAHE